MKTLYIECNMGAAGDMLTAALLELTDNKDAAVKELNNIGISGIEYKAVPSNKCGIAGTHMNVLVDGEEEEIMDVNEHNHDHPHPHVHRTMSDVAAIIDSLNISDKVREDVKAIYNLIAQAESHAHGAPVDQIHFHEVGNMDAIADVTAAAYLIDKIGASKIVVSPINTGKGQVKCAHGIIPVPAPATAYILRGVPTYNNWVESELCTPTGAAILKYYADEFTNMPVMTVDKIGYGMGTKDFKEANCVRIMLGETLGASDKVIELNCNVDDMTGEDLGFASERILSMGAREVFITPVIMKKSRPGNLITVICSEEKKKKMVSAIFKYTTTIGIRETVHNRYVLERHIEEHDTKFGSIHAKVSDGYGITRIKYEHDELAKMAIKNNMSIEEVRSMIKK